MEQQNKENTKNNICQKKTFFFVKNELYCRQVRRGYLRLTN